MSFNFTPCDSPVSTANQDHHKNLSVFDKPVAWTTGLMAPEAYTLHDALTGYINNESNESVRIRAAKAYPTYQKCKSCKEFTGNG